MCSMQFAVGHDLANRFVLFCRIRAKDTQDMQSQAVQRPDQPVIVCACRGFCPYGSAVCNVFSCPRKQAHQNQGVDASAPFVTGSMACSAAFSGTGCTGSSATTSSACWVASFAVVVGFSATTSSAL
uniref:Uncharacterized protein n=1 Tax=Eutreptiella gymnastica TaxID=73025 RepID=A0A6T2A956_9EUGL|mmetsp:Transcript_47588/g.79780  ORF Transcript_47588/g.79780 Transcript_47588/m.79780 type:complete len:127 (+) Transcript_47588:986-1366(+)